MDIASDVKDIVQPSELNGISELQASSELDGISELQASSELDGISELQASSELDGTSAKGNGLNMTGGMASKEAVVREANEIYAELKKMQKVSPLSADMPDFEEKVNERLKYFQTTHKEFNETYPIPLRYAIVYGQYDTKTFSRFLDKVARDQPWKDADAFLQTQADYAGMMYRTKKPRASPKEVAAVRRDAYETLKKETDDFKKRIEDAKKAVLEKENTIMAKRKKDLMEHIMGKVEAQKKGELSPEAEKELESLLTRLGIIKLELDKEYPFVSEQLKASWTDTAIIPNGIYDCQTGEKQFIVEFLNGQVSVIYNKAVYGPPNLEVAVFLKENGEFVFLLSRGTSSPSP